ncbi:MULTISPECIES: hypothetical protein [unclassified Sporosarcina]|uniref:hypothetical protein n=1 Tax=unclassified Sporosarcina TaxID=2647733 RepID=UPI001A91DDAD|nr:MULTISPECIES: hypothetical protein [unclassified Sporosarcina]MBO0588619.1 hypothetical protein [Sporosarcina sp. E16_8]MBO0603555.1 hypothetical protein [Sporosarcina sp. E16_3]
MERLKKVSLKSRLITGIIVFVILISVNYYFHLFKPKNSLDLYQSMTFADDFEEAQSLMLEGYEANFKEEDFEFINGTKTVANSINQFALFEYDERSYLIMTSPGTQGIRKLKVLAVEELPTEIRDYFLELSP